MPYKASEENALPPSFRLAAHNRLSHQQVLSAELRVGNSLPYFFYGAQMFPSILLGTSKMNEVLTNVALNMTPALVRGFRRHVVRGHSYPAAVRSTDNDASVVGMLAFSIPNDVQRSFDTFQGGTSEMCVARANVVLKDGNMCSIDCRMYVSSARVIPLLVHQDERIWQVSDLMQDKWHLRNLTASKAQEEHAGAILSEL
jgi:hypothetical protein